MITSAGPRGYEVDITQVVASPVYLIYMSDTQPVTDVIAEFDAFEGAIIMCH